MVGCRCSLPGLFAVLLALMVQLGLGATVPRTDPGTLVAGSICHVQDDASGGPSSPPGHPADCLVCPLCISVHAPSLPLLAAAVSLPSPPVVVVARIELPPPSTAPPSAQRSPNQPRAPPTYS